MPDQIKPKIIVPTYFENIMVQLERLIVEAADAIDLAELEYFIPFHYNTIEATIPSYHVQKYMPGVDADITVTFIRTKLTEKHNLKYTRDNLFEFYKHASITIGKHGSNKVYHVNARASLRHKAFWYRMIRDNVTRLWVIHDKNEQFDLSADAINEIINDRLFVVNPPSSYFPRSFTIGTL